MTPLRVPRAAWAVFGITLSLSFSHSRSAFALSASEAQGRATLAVQGVESSMTSTPPESKLAVKPPTPAERVAAGDMLLRNKDYDRAIEALSKVLELYRQGKAPEAAFADASLLIGEGYMATKQYLSARRHFREILDNGARSPYDGFVGKALSRLVDIALRTDDLPGLDYVFERLARLPATDRSGSLAYARAKALYAKKDYAASKNAVNAVPAGSPYTPQAQYLLGVVLLKEALAATPAVPPAAAAAAAGATPAAPAPAVAPPDARFVQAIEQFRKVTRIPATKPEQEHVVDLAWMAIGRLFYETNNYLDAVEAYSHVGRNSPEFSTTLYELAWVFVRLGDYSRAQRALEVLTITDPNNLELADGSLLRADLMLRSGDFQNALNLYRNVREHFDPIRKSVDDFLASTSDPAVYYDKLTADEATMATETKLPKVVLEWAREQAEDQHVFGMIDDVTRSRDLVKRSRKLAVKLNAVLSVPTRIKAFPELRSGLQYSMSLMNKLAKARLLLAEGMDDVADRGAGELGRIRSERRALMKRLGWLPVTDGDFLRRDDVGDKQWNKASQVLQSMTVEADKLAAIVNGLKRVLKDADQYGVTADATSRQRFKLEIEANERDLQTYSKRIEEYRDAIENGRAQIGFGDQRYVDDDDVRRKFRELFTREVALVASGQDSGDAGSYAKGIQSLLGRIDIDEQRLEATRSKLERQALEQAQVLRQKIAAEVSSLETYAMNLDSLDQQARLLVGEIAMKNFALVRDRVKNIVLRADVGIVQQAWEVREEQRVRVRNLQRERAREEQNLNDELREVLDDSEDSQ
ncbi:MAG TPA: tetratricopeptide repeat protein [Polyangiaceae bacterium]|nr:tetratricopeptide repeat protein [Polyangiaceae bacterium]